jgi:hypothetical protein
MKAESGKNFITWAWPTSTTIIYNKITLYNLPESDEFVTLVIKVMINFNKGVGIQPNYLFFIW